ncbi:HET-domain-containing protein, partial [Glonium stellatum]
MEPVDDHRNDGAYANSSLPRDNLSIRLLHILPTLETNGLIRCNFIPTRLDAAIPYEALSYCWGDPKKVAQISVNGEPFHVGKNLFSALGVLCHPDTTRTIWIDAICINQNDRKEKGHQVEMMREIYSRSIRAIVWLGPGDFFTHEAIEAESRPIYWIESSYENNYSSVLKLLRRPWFRRI